MKIYTTGRTVAPHNSKKKKKQKRSLQLSERPSSAEYIFLFFVIFIALIGSMSVILRANEMFCSLRSFHEEPCASSASCCLRGCCLFSAIVSRIKDLKQWESVFSATCGFRNHCIKSGYAKSRVTNTRHDTLC